jgi:hypothetical protein
MLRPTIQYADLEHVAKYGPGLATTALGRVFGLGPAERRALAGDGMSSIPGWSWALLGLGAGVVVGIRIYKRWPDKVPKLVQG